MEYKTSNGGVEITCKVCGKKIRVKPSRVHKNNRCSRGCYVKDITGKPNLKVRGKRHGSWKGNEAKYSSIHDYIRVKKGRAGDQKCAFCGKKARDWANIDHKYSRDLDDYTALCRKCHINFDKKI
jgi:hypothetical protein